MTQTFTKTKPSLMEAGLPCASLSAECQRDNNARQRPPQNRLHIWWARRPPTVCRVGILSALLPHDVKLSAAVLPPLLAEPSTENLNDLPAKLLPHRAFFEKLLNEVRPTPLSEPHRDLLRALGVTADSHAAYRRIAAAQEYLVGNKPIQMPPGWAYNHPPAFSRSPSSDLIKALLGEIRKVMDLCPDEPVVMLDYMAGGGAIPLEGIRHGLKVYSNDLNSVSALVQKATLEYPTEHGRRLAAVVQEYAEEVARGVGTRLAKFFYKQPPSEWWPECRAEAEAKFRAASLIDRQPAGNERIQATLWCRTIACPKCSLNIPLSTNFHIVNKKGKPEASVAAFPEVPPPSSTARLQMTHLCRRFLCDFAACSLRRWW
jgi:adenine-specific DNA methylase